MAGEIDFDELDKAVASLMGGATPQRQDEGPKQKTLTISSTLKPGEDPAYAKLDEVAKAIGDEILTTDGERTVDVDEAASSQAPSEPVAVRTESPAVASQPIVPPAPQAPAPTAPAAPAAVQAPRPTTGRFMDVVHPSSVMKSPAALDATPPIRANTGAQPVSAASPEANVPLTPFIPDAKVEKRPLGGSGAIPSPFEDDKPVAAVTTESQPAETAAEPVVQETVTINSEPAEGAKPIDAQPVLDASTFENTTPAESPEIAAIESTEVSADAPKTEDNIAAVESGDTEILKTTPAPPNKEGTIYDVSNQAQPLAHAKKQKSGWGTVVVIVVVIAVAAALAVAASFILGVGV